MNPPHDVSAARTSSLKEAAAAFLQLVAGGRVQEAYRSFDREMAR